MVETPLEELIGNPFLTFAGGSLLTAGLGIFIRSILGSNKVLVSDNQRIRQARQEERELWRQDRAELIAYFEAREIRLQQRVDDLEAELGRWQDRMWGVAAKSLTPNDFRLGSDTPVASSDSLE